MENKYRRIFCIVLDSVGIGALPDAPLFGDYDVHTLGHIAAKVGLNIPHLQKLGLGNIEKLHGIEPVAQPLAYHGKMAEVSVAKDTTTGHWELMGLKVEIPFNTYPDGFPQALIKQFEQATGRAVIGNKVASGTAILDELGEEQMKSGSWIVYTSADSVFQIAAHEDTIPLDELYRGCEIARELTLQKEFAVARVIARPYIGLLGSFERTHNRRDYSIKPPAPTVMDYLKNAGFDVIAIGKITDIFADEGITRSIHTKSNTDGMDQTIAILKEDFHGFCFINLVDFDSKYGHRRDPVGYGKAIEEFDARLPEILAHIQNNDLLIITADHGNDPTYTGTDHTREYVPILIYNPMMQNGKSIGVRETFSDVACTIASNFNVTLPKQGTSFLSMLK